MASFHRLLACLPFPARSNRPRRTPGVAALGVALSLGLSAAACGGQEPVAKTPEAEKAAPSKPTQGFEVQSDIGGLPQYEMERAFDELQASIERCVQADHLSVVGGEVVVALRIKPNGRARWVHLKDSSIGDRDIERCVLDLFTEQDWPKPVGGDGLAERGFSIQPLDEPWVVEAKDAKPVVKQVRIATAGCRGGGSGTFRATFYVDRWGKVLAAGVAPPKEDAEEACDCMVDKISKMRFGKLQRGPIKISLDL